MGAIFIDPAINRATVNLDECVECFTCHRGMSKEHMNPTLVRAVRRVAKLFRFRFEPEPDVCPTDALTPQELTWPRIVRRAFNDVTGRVKEGEAGFTIEFGRPGVGVRFRDVQKMTAALIGLPVEFEDKNPVSALMTDRVTGALRADILDEKVMSAILELKTRLEHVPAVLERIEAVAQTLRTIVSIGVSTRCDSAGDDRLAPVLAHEGYVFFRGKTNLGLGRRPTPASA
jgi:hypothetical protein